MSTIRTNAAAAMLGVSANTLRSWETRFGHPLPRRTEGGHRLFELSEIEALRQALAETGDAASAVSLARERGEGPSTAQRLAAAFAEFSEERADRLLEESLMLRSVERTVDGVLIPAVEALAEGSSERLLAWRYATGWLAAARRVAPPAARREGVMVFDAGRAGSLDALRVQALELMLRRAGLPTLCLPVAGLDGQRLGGALRALAPAAVVLAGRGAQPPALATLVHSARQACGQIAVFDYLGALPESGASVLPRLPDSPAAAAQELRERLSTPRVTGADEPTPAAIAALRS